MVKIMIVDDHALMRRAVRDVVEKENDFTVVAEACNGFEAEEQAQDTQPDVILMDLDMPGCNGFEATERVLARSPKSRVVIFTASHQERHVFQAIQHGAMGYITKDTEPEALVHAVRCAARNDLCIPGALAIHVVAHLRALWQSQEALLRHAETVARGQGPMTRERPPLASELSQRRAFAARVYAASSSLPRKQRLRKANKATKDAEAEASDEQSAVSDTLSEDLPALLERQLLASDEQVDTLEVDAPAIALAADAPASVSDEQSVPLATDTQPPTADEQLTTVNAPIDTPGMASETQHAAPDEQLALEKFQVDEHATQGYDIEVPRPIGLGIVLRPLSERELQILNLMRTGYKNREIAGVLKIAESTVHKHVQNIFEKLRARNRAEAIYLTTPGEESFL
jgi:DNA-binding NarL/FixJ family response regulator